MHYRAIICLSGAFITLMIFTIGQQIWSFIKTQSNPVSSINVIHNENGFHDSSVIVISAIVLKKGKGIDLEFGNYSMTENCVCVNSTTLSTTDDAWYDCSRLLNFKPNRTEGDDSMLFEAPVNWLEQQVVALICDHPVNQTVAFIFVVLTENFDNVHRRWISMDLSERANFVEDSFNGNVQTWAHCNFYTNIRFSKVEYYKQHEPEGIHIQVSSSSTQNVIQGQTRMNFAWQEGFVTRIDKFSDHSIWSFAMLLCAVLLGLERCYAILNRARAQRAKQRNKSIAAALTAMHNEKNPKDNQTSSNLSSF